MRAMKAILPSRIARTVLPVVLSVVLMSAAQAQKAFDTPEAAMNAFGDAVATSNDAAITALLGQESRRMIPPVGADLRYRFLSAWSQSHRIEGGDDGTARVAVGNNGWTLPIPLVKSNGRWHFDVKQGVTEIRLRHIGRNELSTIQTMLAIYDAQHDYALSNPEGNGLTVYARKLVSSPGKKDGLYWPTRTGEPESPLGPAFIDAVSSHRTESDGYNGYRYKLLNGQGPTAPGGKYTYLVNGKLFGGFAVLAWPARYGETGIKSFMVSHDGQVYERDLGRDTGKRAAGIETFDPGAGWSKVAPELLQPVTGGSAD
ncbi:DUF2950 domain-containing protein [Cupriavidus pauculus]|uniref:DUF2950 domain-containing protein n=1 Tax=Cupriavidus pauculus TaxID=82633 RepID=A0A2N5CF05_9BURK|nr:DUF2950 domain-containing protein [Cupriavidus pauculus]PLQ00796.1 DUF2950 domain-containing protein [Cupriavidus pauculus]